MLCRECPSRSICQSACPELELYLQQVDPPQREKTIGAPVYGRKIQWPSGVVFTRKQREIVTLLVSGLSRHEVCETINITSVNLRKAISRIRAKHTEMSRFIP